MQVYRELEQLSDEWFKLRLGKITGSSMHDFLTKGGGKTRNKRIYTLVAERMTGKRSDSSFSNKHTERGHELEDEARLIYEMETGNLVETAGFVDFEKDNIGYSPDGLIGNTGIIEIKCKDNHTFVEQLILKVKAIEKSYITQMQFGMYVCEADWCDYVCYNPNFKNPFIHRINRDEKFIKTLKEEILIGNIEIDKIIKEITK